MNGLFYDTVLRPFEIAGLRKLRSELLSHAHGKSLEIGVGTGLNLPFYPKDAEVIGIEPDEKMMIRSLKRARQLHARVEAADAMNLPYPDDSFDTVVATLVFCTIPDPAKAMQEAWRVLRPGGRFLLLEHVRTRGPISGKLLDIATPVWKHLAGGCHLNRDPSDLIVRAGFKTEEFKTLWKGLGKVWVLKK